MDNFKIVKRKSRKKVNNDEYEEDSPIYIEKHQKKLKSVKSSIKGTQQLISFIQSIDKSVSNNPIIEDIICYGLGNFTRSPTSLYQYAMALELSEYYKCPLYLYDPLFTTTEMNIMSDMNSNVIPTNEYGKRKVDKNTLFFLPHCPWDIFNNILQANWTNLNNCIVLGNNVSTMMSSLPDRILKDAHPYLFKIYDFVQIIQVDNNFEYEDVFNDMAVHVFPLNKILELNFNQLSLK